MKILFVAGTFGDQPQASGYAYKLFTELYKIKHKSPIDCITFINGGTLDLLYCLSSEVYGDYDVIIWMPEVSNDVPKVVDKIKELYPHALLVISKRIKKDTPYLQLAARMLKVRANLMLELTDIDGRFAVRVLDPLGNQFALPENDPQDISQVGTILRTRIIQLTSITRVHTQCLSYGNPERKIPQDCYEFFEIAREHAATFHNLIHVDNTRFLGNLSFRCENGFPSFKNDDNQIYVSRRNIDKREIAADGFVPVAQVNDAIVYFGPNKPSVDTPIQIKLYHHYRNVRYMLHSHVYAELWPFTSTVLPCGALEEADEVIKLFQSVDDCNFCVNLLGHGSLVLARDVDFIRGIKYISRNIPELQVLQHDLC